MIQCSGRKTAGGEPNPAASRGVWPAELDRARDGLRTSARVDEGLLMPAWRRYDGSFYRSAGASLRTAVERGNPVVILSGGYGLLLPDELIGTYDRRFSVRDWPAGLLSTLLVQRAAAAHVATIIAFVSRSTDYARVVRGAGPLAGGAGLNPVLLVSARTQGGGAMVKVPQALGAAFSAFCRRQPSGYPAELTIEAYS